MKKRANLFIAGAPKSGTTSLYHYLERHPEVFASEVKEPRFYTGSEFLKGPYKEPLRGKIISNEEKYLDLYKNAEDEKYLLDGSVYIMFFKSSMEKIKKAVPDAKILIIIRNPVERIYSHYKMLHNMNYEKRRFSKFIKYPVSIEGINLLEVGLYSSQIENAFSIFGKDNVKIIVFEEFKKDVKKALEEVYVFLSIDIVYPDNLETIYLKSRGDIKNRFSAFIFRRFKLIWVKLMKYNNSVLIKLKNKILKLLFRNRKMNSKMKEKLYEYYIEDIIKTERITGLDLNEWKIKGKVK